MIKYLLSIDKKYFRILYIGWTCAILFLLLSNGSQEESFFSKIPHFDKLAHFSIFMIWTALLGLSWSQARIMVLFILLISFAVITEYLQSFIVYRTADVFDAIIDVIGGVFGYYLIKYLKKSQ